MGFVGNIDSPEDWDATELAIRSGQPDMRGLEAETFLAAFRLGFIAGHCQARIRPEVASFDAYQQFKAGK